jgi:hypothetical protein
VPTEVAKSDSVSSAALRYALSGCTSPCLSQYALTCLAILAQYALSVQFATGFGSVVRCVT